MKRIYLTIIALIATITICAQTIEVYEYDENGNICSTPAYFSTNKVKVIFSETKHHEYVDLGLPSGTLWATCNIGADTPEESGLFFAWGEVMAGGEIDPKNNFLYSDTRSFVKSRFTWSQYKYYRPSQSKVSKYICMGSWLDNLHTLESCDDAAYVRWGADWRMPTYAEFEELADYANCSWVWYDKDNAEFKGVAGFKVQSKIEGYNDKYIFLPASGFYTDNMHFNDGSSGRYWSSELSSSSDNEFAYCLLFGKGGGSTSSSRRHIGMTIRPVYVR